MAYSGSFTTSNTGGIGAAYPKNATYSWWVNSQSTANNTTEIGYKLVLGGGTSSGSTIAVYGCSTTTDGEGKSYSGGGTYYGNGKVLISGTKTITHNADGTKSFSASATINLYWSSGHAVSGSGSWSLPTIPRKATIKSAPNFNDEENPTITYENKAGNSVSSLNAGIFLDGWTAVADYRAIPKTGSSYTFNLTTEERNAIRAAMPNSNSRTVRFYVQTTIGSNTFLDYKEATVSIVNGNPTFTNYTFHDGNSTTTTITGNNQWIIQNKSSLVVDITSANKAVAKKSASMSSYVYEISSYSGSENYTTSDLSKTIGAINANANQNLKVTAKDSRGNSTAVSKTVNIVPYATPVLNVSATRQNNFEANTTIKVSGSASLLKVNGVVKNAVNATSGVQYRKKQSSTTTWESWTNISSSYNTSTGAVTVSDFVISLDNQQAWDLEFKITDKLETKTVAVSVSQGQPQFFIGADGRASVGGLPSVAKPSGNLGQLEVYGDVYSKSKKLMTLDNVYPVGSIFMSMNHTTPEQVATALGGGTWEAWGAGRFPVGVGVVDANNDDWCGHTSAGDWTANPNGKGGETYHTLTVNEMPSHRHYHGQVYSGYHLYQGGNAPNGVYTGYAVSDPTNYVGGSQAHNNMPPYITVYMWKRTA